MPDDRLGDVGMAFVVPRPGMEIEPDELIAWARAEMANFKVPRQVEFRSELPRTPAGKPLKRLLRKESA